MGQHVIIILSLFALTICAQAQFYDLFQGFQPFLQNFQTAKPDHNSFEDFSLTRPRSDRRNDDGQTDRQKSVTRERSTVKPRRKTTVNSNIESVTPKSLRKSNKNSSLRNNSKSKNEGSGRGQFYSDTNNNQEYYTTKSTTRRNYDQNYNSYTQRPGVRPAAVDTNRPPITNRPPTTKAYAVYPRPTDSGAIRFPEDSDTSPEVLVGPDESKMSNVEKRRYINLAERMCEKYKSLSVKKLEAIPLLPSPDPVQVNVSVCPLSTVPLVVGGKVVSIEEFPHMALLGWTKVTTGGYAWKCGGSLISDQYVLTAGHCAYQEKDDSVVLGAPRVVQLGSSYMDDRGALVVKVLNVVRHPKYIRPSSYYDIALVKMVKPVTFSQVVKPACLGDPPGVGEPMIATGWGRTEYGGTQSLELRSVSVPIWDMDECKEVLGVSRKMPNGPSRDSQICAGTKGKDTCQGDSGGPAQIQEDCIWRVVAVTSVGRSCGAPNTPAIYATLHRAFIAAQVFGKTTESTTQRNGDNPQNVYETSTKLTRPNNNRPNRNDNQGAWSTTQKYNNNGNRNNNQESWSSNNQQSNGNKNNNQGSWVSTTQGYNNNGNRNNNQGSWGSNNQQNNNGNRNNNQGSWVSTTQGYNNNNGNRNNNQDTWSSNSQPSNNGNVHNNQGTWSSSNSQNNNNGNRGNNQNTWNSNSQQANNNNYNGNNNQNVWTSDQHDTNNERINSQNNYNDNYGNGNRHNNYQSTTTANKAQNYNSNSGTYYSPNRNTNHQGSYGASYNVQPENTSNYENNKPEYNYNNNNNNRDELIYDYYDSNRMTTKRPIYSNNGWYNFGF